MQLACINITCDCLDCTMRKKMYYYSGKANHVYEYADVQIKAFFGIFRKRAKFLSQA